ncbi:ankyrin repeat domain-containing protein 16-like isoform X1 [Macrobrachium rosenbergii]|uniref:ankyrin repeat domain-containing protein 16-like isoform X1 n=1 Tax=Macrobrachium rosenbergii TaxID=79674 RepID=UPI0034D3D726
MGLCHPLQISVPRPCVVVNINDHRLEIVMFWDLLSAVHRSDIDWLESNVRHLNVDWQTCVHSKSGDTALHIAAQAGCTQVLGWLLSNGCDCCLEQQNLDGKRPLHSAVQASHLPIVKILLDHGVAVDPLKRADWTPLMLACTKKNLQIVKYLISHGANIRLVNKDGWTSFHLACREGTEAVILYLLELDGSLWNTVSNNGRTPLHTAAMHGRKSTVQLLLSRGNYAADEADACGNTPLMEALRMGHVEIAEMLISDHQASVFAKDKTGRMGLHIAAEAGQLEVVQLLIEKYCVDVNLLSDTGLTALHCAAKEGQLSVVDALLNIGCKTDTQDENGRTALWLACGGRKAMCVKKLLQVGAQDIADNKGTLPSQLMSF